jgi:hypothetical protein
MGLIRRLLLVMVLIVAGFVVVVAPPLAWAFNLVPLSRVDPDEGDRENCQQGLGPDSYYFSVVDHRWVCHDNWLFLVSAAGVHGV